MIVVHPILFSVFNFITYTNKSTPKRVNHVQNTLEKLTLVFDVSFQVSKKH